MFDINNNEWDTQKIKNETTKELKHFFLNFYEKSSWKIFFPQKKLGTHRKS